MGGKAYGSDLGRCLSPEEGDEPVVVIIVDPWGRVGFEREDRFGRTCRENENHGERRNDEDL